MATLMALLPVDLQELIVLQLLDAGDKLTTLKALTAWAAIPLPGNTRMTQDTWRQACKTVFGLPSETGDDPAFGQQKWRAVFNRLSVELGVLCWAVAPAFFATSDTKPRRWLARFARVECHHNGKWVVCNDTMDEDESEQSQDEDESEQSQDEDESEQNQTGCSCGQPNAVATPTLERLMAMRVPPPHPPRHEAKSDRMLVRSTTAETMTVALDAGANPNRRFFRNRVQFDAVLGDGRIQQLLEAGAKPEGSLLARAAWHGNINAVQMMLNVARRAGIDGDDMNSIFSAAWPQLLQMTKCGSTTRYNAVKILLDARVMWSIGDALNEMFYRRHGLLDDLRVVQMLLTAGATPTNAVYTSVDTDNVEFMHAILDAGATPIEGVLARAVDKGSVEIVQMLLKCSWTSATFSIVQIVQESLEKALEKELPLYNNRIHTPYGHRTLAIVQMLLDKGAKPTDALLNRATRMGSVEIVQALLGAGATPTEGLLTWAVDKGSVEIVRMLLDDNYHISRRAMPLSVPLPLIDRFLLSYGDALLNTATRMGSVEIVQALLSAGAKPTDALLNTAIRTGDAQIVQAMLIAGAKPTKGLLAWAVDTGSVEIVRILLDAHAAPTGELLENAIDQGHDAIVRALLTKDGTLATTEALERACSCPRGRPVRNASIVQAMLDKGAIPTDKAFYNAYRSGDGTVVQVLLKLRAEPGLLDACSSTGFESAGSVDFVLALLAAGANPHTAYNVLCSKYASVRSSDRPEKMSKILDEVRKSVKKLDE